MNFTQYDLGHQKRGTIVRVTLKGRAANVRLMDDSNFRSFKSRGRHSYHGGHARRSPVDLAIPHGGRWHVIVDLGGLRGTTRSAIEILPGPLPAIRQSAPPSLAPISRAADRLAQDRLGGDQTRAASQHWDVFVSHATEDKDGVVRDLVLALQAEELSVWYDEFELRVGDSLRRKIDAGLSGSQFGVVVLSPAFFSKNWPQYELDGLVTREMTGEQIILPVWHQLTKSQVVAESPSLADKIALTTAQLTAKEIAAQIAEVVRAHGQVAR